jgi:hypothetical protein
MSKRAKPGKLPPGITIVMTASIAPTRPITFEATVFGVIVAISFATCSMI